jgi:retron-type reverse transcriptase
MNENEALMKYRENEHSVKTYRLLVPEDALDKWLELKHPQFRFVRYADDAIIHCYTLSQAEQLLQAIKQRMQDCGLEVNEKKSKIAYCKKAGRKAPYKTVSFDFTQLVLDFLLCS